MCTERQGNVEHGSEPQSAWGYTGHAREQEECTSTGPKQGGTRPMKVGGSLPLQAGLAAGTITATRKPSTARKTSSTLWRLLAAGYGKGVLLAGR